jgi:PPOX class probable F420-dependent enzyme
VGIVIFDPETEKGAHALERLGTAKVAWLTTVTPEGQPQSMPVWFTWNGNEIVVYGDHRARRNANLAMNTKVGFHLPENGQGGDIVVIEGIARVDRDYPAVPDNGDYLAKYGDWVDGMGGPATFAETYNVPIRITPTRGVAFRG